MTREQVLEQSIQSVRFARNLTDDVEFSPEDGYRSDPDFLCRVLEAVIKEGATHDQHPRHGRLRRARAVRPVHPRPAREDPERRQGGLVGALPQRPRHGGGQLAGRRDDRRRAPGRVHDQRPGRARRQLLARRGRDGGAHAARLLRPRARHRRDADRAGLAHGQPDHRLRRAAEQGGGRRQRLRACLAASTRTACSRRATPTRSCAPRTWAGPPTRSCWASCRAATPSSSA